MKGLVTISIWKRKTRKQEKEKEKNNLETRKGK
jgi:hypothetical protein